MSIISQLEINSINSIKKLVEINLLFSFLNNLLKAIFYKFVNFERFYNNFNTIEKLDS